MLKKSKLISFEFFNAELEQTKSMLNLADKQLEANANLPLNMGPLESQNQETELQVTK